MSADSPAEPGGLRGPSSPAEAAGLRGAAGEAPDTELRSPADRYGARMGSVRPGVAANQLQARVIRQERETLNEVWDAVAEDHSVARAAAVVVGARRRYVTGAGRSAVFARLLEFDLSYGLSQVYLVDGEGGRAMDVLADVRATDVLIAFSVRRYRRDTARFVQEYTRRGGTVVAITDSPDSPLLPHATEAVVVPTTSASVTDSATAMVTVIHLLTALTTASAKGARRRLAERDTLAEDLELY